jgi:hypothetical protein
VTGRVLTQRRDADGYNVTTLTLDGSQRHVNVARALASTFIGPPTTIHHTVDHIDQKRSNDTLSNVRWVCKSGQNKNRNMPSELNTAFIIVKDNVERTAKEWAQVYTKPDGTRYDKYTIQRFAQQQKHGFEYKIFPNLPREVWKAVPNSKSKKGEWFISTKNRMKYKTAHAENVLAVDQLSRGSGYPVVGINGKIYRCHYLSMMTFRPREYTAKLPGDILLHKHDNKLDFNPFRLRWGTSSDNGTDAYDNGKHDGTTSARKPVASYVNDALERRHESICAAVRYLQENGYPKANRGSIHEALNTSAVRYDRMWNSAL